MRRLNPVVTLTTALLTAAAAASPQMGFAQGASRPASRPSPSAPEAPASIASSDPMATARSPRHLLRNGQDYMRYGEYLRALTLFREAEARIGELSEPEQRTLRQAIEEARQGMRSPESASADEGPVAARRGPSRSRGGAMPGAIALAEPPRVDPQGLPQPQPIGPAQGDGVLLTGGERPETLEGLPSPRPATAPTAPTAPEPIALDPRVLPSAASPSAARAQAPEAPEAIGLPPIDQAPAAPRSAPEAPASLVDVPALPTATQAPSIPELPAQGTAPDPFPAPAREPAAAPEFSAGLDLPPSLPDPDFGAAADPGIPSTGAGEMADAMPPLPAGEIAPGPGRPAAEPAPGYVPVTGTAGVGLPPLPGPDYVSSLEQPAPGATGDGLPPLPPQETGLSVESAPDAAPASMAGAAGVGLPPLPAGEGAQDCDEGWPTAALGALPAERLRGEAEAPRPPDELPALPPSAEELMELGQMGSAAPAPAPAQAPASGPGASAAPGFGAGAPSTFGGDAGASEGMSGLAILRPRDTREYRDTLSPEQREEIMMIVRRQEAERERMGLEPAPLPGDPMMPQYEEGEMTGLAVELPRPPSPSEIRPIQSIPIAEDYVPLPPRRFAPSRKLWAASATCHLPLYFQDPVLERYGQSVEQKLGPVGRFLSYPLDDPTQSQQRNQIAQPFFSAGLMAVQIATWPYKALMDTPSEAEYDLGYYRPGDLVPPDLIYAPLHGVGPPLRGKHY